MFARVKTNIITDETMGADLMKNDKYLILISTLICEPESCEVFNENNTKNNKCCQR